MDNEVFRQTYRDINERYCPYEKSLLTNQCRCSLSERFCIAEREGVLCRSDTAQQQCLDLLELMRRQARFTLKLRGQASALPHAQAMGIQVGGLRGIHRLLDPERPPPQPIPDIYATVEAARLKFGTLEEMPFQEIIKEIAAYRGRRPRSLGRR